jgi:2-polyprenyl-3-methyl-5-hydroxy-6-metoxy-1,4-benzoquinol methylase
MTAACRLCGGSTRLLGDRGDVALHRCIACRFVTGIPAIARTAIERYAGYHSEPPPPDPEARYEEWLEAAERLVGRARLLEIGAGRGGFSRVALRRGWNVSATEISRAGIEALTSLGVAVFAGDVGMAGFADGAFDFIVSLEVLEHLPAPAEHLREIHRLTRPGGLLLLTTPNFSGLSRRIFGLGWRVIASEHIGYFEPPTLEWALSSAGYRSVRVRSRSLDVSSWGRRRQGEAPKFDPHRSARMRDAVDRRPVLRTAKRAANAVLGIFGLGDSLLVWARP